MMGLLKNQICYLCGPIDKCPNAGTEWRTTITPFLEGLGIHVLSPCKKNIKNPPKIAGESKSDVEYLNLLKSSGKFDEVTEIARWIRNIDLRCTDKADFIIVNYDMNIHMAGTHEEIVTTNRSKKPVLIMCPQGKQHIPNWYYGMLPHEFFFNRWVDLENYLRRVNCGMITHKRWIFFGD